MPALLTKTSSRPNRRRASATSAATSARCVTSVAAPRLPARVGDAAGQRLKAVHPPSAEHEPGAARSEEDGRRLPDPAARARDRHDLARDPRHAPLGRWCRRACRGETHNAMGRWWGPPLRKLGSRRQTSVARVQPCPSGASTRHPEPSALGGSAPRGPTRAP